jgi:hypothetical protein
MCTFFQQLRGHFIDASKNGKNDSACTQQSETLLFLDTGHEHAESGWLALILANFSLLFQL